MTEQDKNFEFKVGDIVEFGGLEGVVSRDDFSDDLPIVVTLNEGGSVWFTLDGRLDTYHTKPLLILKERPKKKVKKKIYIGIMPHRKECGLLFTKPYFSKDKLLAFYKGSVIKYQTIEGEIEIEEG